MTKLKRSRYKYDRATCELAAYVVLLLSGCQTTKKDIDTAIRDVRSGNDIYAHRSRQRLGKFFFRMFNTATKTILEKADGQAKR